MARGKHWKKFTGESQGKLIPDDEGMLHIGKGPGEGEVTASHVAAASAQPQDLDSMLNTLLENQQKVDVSKHSFAALETMMNVLEECASMRKNTLPKLEPRLVTGILACLAELQPIDVHDGVALKQQLQKKIAWIDKRDEKTKQSMIWNFGDFKSLREIAEVNHPVLKELGEVDLHVAAKASLAKFGTAWLELPEAVRNTSEFKAFADYFTAIRRPYALEVLSQRFAAILKGMNPLNREEVPLPPVESDQYAQLRGKLVKALDEYFVILPEKDDNSARTTKQHLLALRETPAVPHALALYDEGDFKAMRLAAKEHYRNLIKAYEKSFAQQPEILDAALQDPTSKLHAFAEMMYAARWAHVAEIVQNEIKTKGGRMFPELKGGQSSGCYLL